MSIIDIIPINTSHLYHAEVDMLVTTHMNPSDYSYYYDELVSETGCCIPPQQNLFLYKIISKQLDSIGEHLIATNEDIMPNGVFNVDFGEVVINPLSTKISYLNGRKSHIHRYLKSILDVLTTSVCQRFDFYTTLHDIFLRGVGRRMEQLNCVVSSTRVSQLLEANGFLLENLISGNDGHLFALSRHLPSMIDNYSYAQDVDFEIDQYGFSEDILADCGLPCPDQFDTITKLFMIETKRSRYLTMSMLKSALSCEFNTRPIVNNFHVPAFDCEENTEFSMSRDRRGFTQELLNKLEMTRYTDLSIEFDLCNGQYSINHANSIWTNLDPIQSIPDDTNAANSDKTFVEHTMEVIGRINTGMFTPVTNNVTVSLIKTFAEDVYLQFKNKNSGEVRNFYFNLGLLPLATKGIISPSEVNYILSNAEMIPHWRSRPFENESLAARQLTY